MALTFVLSSVGWIPSLIHTSHSSSSSALSFQWNTILPPGGSTASAFLQSISLTLATPLLLLGTSLRGKALRQCGALLGSFAIASAGTLAGATLAFCSSSLGIQRALMTSLPNGDGMKIAAALLAKNIGGGINYMAVCSCLNASPESIAAGLCVDNVMALVYFPLVSILASKYEDLSDNDAGEANAEGVSIASHERENGDDDLSPIEALSHAFTLAAILTALGQFLNSKLHHLPRLLGRDATSDASPLRMVAGLLVGLVVGACGVGGANGRRIACGVGRDATSDASPLNLSLPITTLLAVLFSTYYPSSIFLSPTSSSSNDNDDGQSNNIAKAGETLGTSLLYLFFATAGAPGWRLKDSIQQSFPSIASFLIILYGVHGAFLWIARKLVNALVRNNNDGQEEQRGGFWNNVVAPQRLLVGSSAAIGGPATAAALAKSFEWESLLTPSLLVGNVGYAVATFIGLIFYGVFR
eukprot:CAMPEP_0183743962 /NCGR_PEP_ID=MMETSP0737-20130205/65488_1 /TAXON_ID=385413 /ORGANISM="Thalassiosira miniscula, Strain CCMP1093" /LENGTH=469 /DNA_ID=CAMNT_0025979595 /DNA_START=376 /DNA_END=1786 /DNA_ORIENTATION=-